MSEAIATPSRLIRSLAKLRAVSLRLMAVFGLLVSGTILFMANMPWPVCAGFAVIAIGLLVHDIRCRGGLELVGPHFFYELIQLARKGRLYSIRTLYMSLILLGLIMVYQQFAFGADFWTRLFDTEAIFDRNELSNLAQSFVFTILTVQTAAVVILTPAYVAGAIAEERERRSLEILFTTHLRDREIVVGKLCARVVHLAAILFASLPILSLIQLWGGVEMGVLLAGFANTVLMLFSIGSVTILISVTSHSVTTAIISSYAIIIPFGACFFGMSIAFATPLALLIGLNPGTASPTEYLGWTVLGLTIVHGIITFFALSLAIMSLRVEGPAPVPPQEGARLATARISVNPPTPVQIDFNSGPRTVPQQDYDLPPMTERPLLWKEMFLGVGVIGADQILLMLALVQFLVWMSFGFYEVNFIHGMFVAATGFIALKVGFRAAGSVVRERQQRTLDSLLILPIERREILRAKWLGSLLFVRMPLLFWFFLVVAASFVLHPWSGPLLLVAVSVHLAFVISLGVLISVNARTSHRAQFTLAVWILIILVSSLLIEFYDPSPWPTWWSSFATYGLNPLMTWWVLGFPERLAASGTVSYVHWSAVLAGVVTFVILTWLCWRLAIRDFHRERKPAKGD